MCNNPEDCQHCPGECSLPEPEPKAPENNFIDRAKDEEMLKVLQEAFAEATGVDAVSVQSDTEDSCDNCGNPDCPRATLARLRLRQITDDGDVFVSLDDVKHLLLEVASMTTATVQATTDQSNERGLRMAVATEGSVGGVVHGVSFASIAMIVTTVERALRTQTVELVRGELTDDDIWAALGEGTEETGESGEVA